MVDGPESIRGRLIEEGFPTVVGAGSRLMRRWAGTSESEGGLMHDAKGMMEGLCGLGWGFVFMGREGRRKAEK